MPSSAAARYLAVSRRASAALLAGYSTSFTLAVALLPARMRRDMRALYAMVRIADEIVDGAAAPGAARGLLEDYERAVREAPARSFHPDPVLHAYADTARRCAFREEHLAAFFVAMRSDLPDATPGERLPIDRYIYGSAEVVGLLCVAVFTEGAGLPAEAEAAARRLGAAFQKINFLRDIGADEGQLGRAYLPQPFDDAAQRRYVAEIRADLEAGRAGIPALPRGARPAVRGAADLYACLLDRLAAVPACELRARRVRVSGVRKAAVIARALRGR